MEKLDFKSKLTCMRRGTRCAWRRPAVLLLAGYHPAPLVSRLPPAFSDLLSLVSKARILISGCFWIGAAGLATLMVTAEASEKSEKTGGEKPTDEVTDGSSSEEEDDGVEIPCDFVEKMDHYERLGVKKGASEADIKKASDPLLFPRCCLFKTSHILILEISIIRYRKTSLVYHPDKNKGKAKACAQKHFMACAKVCWGIGTCASPWLGAGARGAGVGGRERVRDRQRQRERETDVDRHTEREREGERGREGERERGRESERERERERQTENERERVREREGERERDPLCFAAPLPVRARIAKAKRESLHWKYAAGP